MLQSRVYPVLLIHLLDLRQFPRTGTLSFIYPYLCMQDYTIGLKKKSHEKQLFHSSLCQTSLLSEVVLVSVYFLNSHILEILLKNKGYHL